MVVMVQINPELAKSAGDSSPSPSSSSAAMSQPSNGRPGSVYSLHSSSSPRDSYYPGNSRHASVSSRHSVHPSTSLSTSPFGYGTIGEDFDPAADGGVGDDDDLPVGFHFTFIPPNPRKYYKRLLECCISADLEAMLSPSVGDDDEVSLGILSPQHIELINECALRWRIGQTYRAACFLEIVKGFYERNEVPLECVPEALGTIGKVMHEFELEKWPLQDVSVPAWIILLAHINYSGGDLRPRSQREYLAQIYSGLFSIFLSNLYHEMDHIPNLKPSSIAPYLHILDVVQQSNLLGNFDADILARIHDIEEQVKSVAARYYEEKNRELHEGTGVNRALPFLLMTDEMEKNAKLLDKRFPEPLLG